MKRRYIVMGVVIVLLWIFSAAFGNRPKSGSTFSAAPEGAKALFLLFEQTGLPVRKWFNPFSELTSSQSGATLFVVSPLKFGGEYALIEWVRNGNRLVYLDNATQSGAKLRRLLRLIRNTEMEISLDSLLERDRTESVFQTENSPIANELRHVYEISELGGVPLIAPGDATVVAGSPNKAKIIRSVVGGGDIWYFSDSTPIINRNIDRVDNMRLLYQIASNSSAILFDEFHHGFTEPLAQKEQARLDYVYFFIACIVVWLLIGTASRAVRFGPPVPVTEFPPSSSVDFVSALGLLYAEERSSSVLRGYVAAWRNRMEKLLSISSGYSNRQLTDEMIYQGIVNKEAAEKILRFLESMESAPDNCAEDWNKPIEQLENAYEQGMSA